MTVFVIPYLSDNYGYILLDKSSSQFCIIDGGDPSLFLKTMDYFSLSSSDLLFILTTHKHWDHAGGNQLLRLEFPDVPFYGSLGDMPD